MGQKSPCVSLYEQSREERIKENLQRMQQLGIADLSKKLNSAVRPKRTPKYSRSFPVLPTRPVRRSSRLQKTTPVSCSEVLLSMKYKGLKNDEVKLEAGSKPEIYTEEHEKLLGNSFVEGYGEDGGQVYCSVKGKTCHQCMKKTLGHHTQCSECNMVQRQFCGRCLHIRYGEHLLEALENQNWICPVCRGICNCSFSRRAEGLCPTGPLYKKIARLGFKSVAHYLIQTQCAQTTLEEIRDTVNHASAKRPLSLSDSKALLKDSSKVDGYHQLMKRPQSEDVKDDDDLDIDYEKPGSSYPSNNHQTSTKRSPPPLSNVEAESKNVDSTEFC